MAKYSKDELRGLVAGGMSVSDALLLGLFDKQLRFILDPSRKKAALCGRRSGKSHTAPRYLVREALDFPGTRVLYIALTRRNAKRLIWAQIKNTLDLYDIKFKSDEQELVIELANGSEIWLSGADKIDQIEKFRGFSFRLIILDECASYGAHFEQLIEDVLEPCLSDYDGSLVLCGTPGVACAGKFYAITNEDGEEYKQYSHHSWTVLDNPEFPLWAGKDDWRSQAKKFLYNKRMNKGWSLDNPTYQREWLGKWVRAKNLLVYRYEPDRNSYDGIHKRKRNTKYVLGIDLGYDDLTTWVVWAFDEIRSGQIFEVYEFGSSGLGASDVAEKTKELQAFYEPIATVADTGGLGKMVVDEMCTRHGLNITPARKDRKADFIELINSDLHEGRIKVIKGGELENEYSRLPWDEDRKHEHPKFSNHYCDAALYAWREAYHWAWIPEQEKPKSGTEDFNKAEEERMFEEAIREQLKKQCPEDFIEEKVELEEDFLRALAHRKHTRKAIRGVHRGDES